MLKQPIMLKPLAVSIAGFYLCCLGLVCLGASCGGDKADRPTIRITFKNEGCNPACAEAVYTFAVLRGDQASRCVLQSIERGDGNGTFALESLPLTDNEEITVAVSVVCKSNPSCVICYGDLDDTLAAQDGQTATLDYYGLFGVLCSPFTLPHPCP